IALSATSWSWAAASGAKPAGKHSPFVMVVLRNWPNWDLNHNGILSPDEIDRAVEDPAVKGPDAAAAAALKVAMGDQRWTLPPLDTAYFATYETTLGPGRARS